MGSLLAVALPIQPRNNAPDLEKIMHALRDWNYPPALFETFWIDGIALQRQASNHRESTLFMGDSLMGQYAPRISAQVSAHPAETQSVLFATAGGCWPIPDLFKKSEPGCRQAMTGALQLARRPEVTDIVIGGNWAYFADQKDLDSIFSSLEQMLREFSASHRTTVLLNGPMGPEFDPTTMYTGSRLTTVRPKDHAEAIPIEAVMRKQGPVRDVLKSIATRSGADVIDALAFLCPTGKCMVATADGRPLYKDSDHMRPFYVLERADFIDRTILFRRSAAP
jgi:hypothetical protein